MSDAGKMSLSQDVCDALAAAYSDYHAAVSVRSAKRAEKATFLANYATMGHDAGWSYKSMAEPMGISPERLRQIVKDHTNGKKIRKLPKWPVFETPTKPRSEPKAVRNHLTYEQAKLLQSLAGDARQNKGSRPLDSKYRKASEDFSELIKEHHSNGVIWQEISDATRPWTSWPLEGKELEASRGPDADHYMAPMRPQQTVSGLRMRAARHGYGKGAPPSIPPYRRVVIHPVAKDDSVAESADKGDSGSASKSKDSKPAKGAKAKASKASAAQAA